VNSLDPEIKSVESSDVTSLVSEYGAEEIYQRDGVQYRTGLFALDGQRDGFAARQKARIERKAERFRTF